MRAISQTLLSGCRTKCSLFFDIKVIDGLVNLTAGTVRFAGSLLRYVQTGVTQSYAIALVLGTILVVTMLLFG